MFDKVTVEENLATGLRLCRDAGAAASFGRLNPLFPKLKGRRRQLAGTMSGGEQQICAMGRALMAKPRFPGIVEKNLGLAPRDRHDLPARLINIRAEGIAVLLVEQDVFAAFSVADCTHVMETGRVVRAGAVRASKGDTAVINACLGVADQGLPPASG